MDIAISVALGIIIAVVIIVNWRTLAYITWIVFKLTFTLVLFSGLGLVATLYVGP